MATGWVIAIIATLAGQTVTVEYSEVFATEMECKMAIPAVARHLHPMPEGIIGFDCRQRERRI